MTTTIKYKEWQLIVDKKITLATYAAMSMGSAEICNCNDCRNFVKNRETIFPTEIKHLFEELGIDFRKESRVTRIEKLENGLHHYTGWFHFKGYFIGKDCSVPLEGGGYAFDLTPITEKFSLGFCVDIALTFFDDKENLVQIEFDAVVPWILDKELEK